MVGRQLGDPVAGTVRGHDARGALGVRGAGEREPPVEAREGRVRGSRGAEHEGRRNHCKALHLRPPFLEGQVRYERDTVSVLPLVVTASMRTRNVPFGNPRRSTFGLSLRPRRTTGLRVAIRTVACLSFTPCVAKKRSVSVRGLTHERADGATIT